MTKLTRSDLKVGSVYTGEEIGELCVDGDVLRSEKSLNTFTCSKKGTIINADYTYRIESLVDPFAHLHVDGRLDFNVIDLDRTYSLECVSPLVLDKSTHETVKTGEKVKLAYCEATDDWVIITENGLKVAASESVCRRFKVITSVERKPGDELYSGNVKPKIVVDLKKSAEIKPDPFADYNTLSHQHGLLTEDLQERNKTVQRLDDALSVELKRAAEVEAQLEAERAVTNGLQYEIQELKSALEHAAQKDEEIQQHLKTIEDLKGGLGDCRKKQYQLQEERNMTERALAITQKRWGQSQEHAAQKDEEIQQHLKTIDELNSELNSTTKTVARLEIQLDAQQLTADNKTNDVQLLDAIKLLRDTVGFRSLENVIRVYKDYRKSEDYMLPPAPPYNTGMPQQQQMPQPTKTEDPPAESILHLLKGLDYVKNN